MCVPGSNLKRKARTGIKLEAYSLQQDQNVSTNTSIGAHSLHLVIKLEAQSVYRGQNVRTGIKLEAQSAYRDPGSSLRRTDCSGISTYLTTTALKRTAYVGVKLGAQSVYRDQEVCIPVIELEAQSADRDQA